MKLFRIFFAFTLCFFITFAAFSQSSSAELKKKKDKLNKEIAALNKTLQQTSGNKKRSLKQVNALQAQIRLREEKITTINTEIGLLNNQINENTTVVHQLQNDLEKLRANYKEMVLFAARNRNSYTTLMFIFSSTDFNQAYKRMKYVSQFNQYRKKRAAEIEGTQQQLAVKINELDKNKKEKSELLNDKVEEKQLLDKQKNQKAKEVQQLTTKEKQLSKQLSARQLEAKKLNAEITAAVNREIELERKRQAAIAAAKAKAEADKAAAIKKANPGSPAPKPIATAPKPASTGSAILAASPEGAKLSANFVTNKGLLPWPVAAGRIVEGFGKHTYGIDVIMNNTGVKIQTNPGASAMAVFEGEVFSVRNLGGSYVVMVKHGEYITIYADLRSAAVSRGQKVSTRQVLGTVGIDQYDQTTKLHFEVRKGISPMNPAVWLAGK